MHGVRVRVCSSQRVRASAGGWTSMIRIPSSAAGASGLYGLGDSWEAGE